MKHTNVLIIAILFNLHSYGQQRSLSKVVNISLPINAVQLDSASFKKYVKTNFQRFSEIRWSNNGIYKLDNILFSFYDRHYRLGKISRTLTAEQNEVLSIFRGPTATSDVTLDFYKTINVNNIQFLVYQYRRQDEVYLRFLSEYRNDRDIAGILQFKMKDKEQADHTLDVLLQSISFKD